MTRLSSNAQLVSAIFEEVAKGNGAPFWDACHDDVAWRKVDIFGCHDLLPLLAGLSYDCDLGP